MIVIRLDRIKTTGPYLLNRRSNAILDVCEIRATSVVVKQNSYLIEVYDGALYDNGAVLYGLVELRARADRFMQDVTERIQKVNRELLFATEQEEIVLNGQLKKLYDSKIPRFVNKAFILCEE